MAKEKTSITTENRSGSAADAAAKEQRTEMPLSDLHPFEGHPFKVLDDELMEQTVESIKQIGVVSPLIVRPDPEGGFEILSGHRRLHVEIQGIRFESKDNGETWAYDGISVE